MSPKARAMRSVTANVGFAFSRSIWLNIERLTPLALARDSKDQPRAPRKCFTRPPRCRLTASAGSAPGSIPAPAPTCFFIAAWKMTAFWIGSERKICRGASVRSTRQKRHFLYSGNCSCILESKGVYWRKDFPKTGHRQFS